MGRGKSKGREGVYIILHRQHGVIGGEQRQDEELNGQTEIYLEKKRLEVNTSKTKIIRFRKGGSKMKKKTLEIEVRKD